MSNRKPLERRTFSQDRYEILIKRQRSGKATFKELSELDEIVNRDPAIRERVLIENLLMQRGDDNTDAGNLPDMDVQPATLKHQSMLQQFGAFLGRMLGLHFSSLSLIKAFW